MLVFLIVGASRWAAKHDQTLLSKEEYDDLWRKSPYADRDYYESVYRSITAPPKKPDDSLPG